MKVVILAGGAGTRMAEETGVKPKPMVEIGGRPILWHIMKLYAAFGVSEFIVCLGYKGHVIKEYFANYHLQSADVTFDFAANTVTHHRSTAEPWKVTLIDTGENTMTGGRIRRVLPYVQQDPYFAMTYGDGVADIAIDREIEFHKAHGRLATIAATHPARRFGSLKIHDGEVTSFREKPDGEGGFVNGGFFILSPDVGRYLASDGDVWEREPLERLAADGELRAYQHTGFWHPMDTLGDKNLLDEKWRSGTPPWKLWQD